MPIVLVHNLKPYYRNFAELIEYAEHQLDISSRFNDLVAADYLQNTANPVGADPCVRPSFENFSMIIGRTRG